MVMNLVLLVFLWICWCAMHSLSIDSRVTDFIHRRLPRLIRYYRLLYNGVSLLTLIPLAMFTRLVGGEVVFGWQGWTVLCRMLLLAVALALFFAGAKRYDLRHFLGIRQLQSGEDQLLMSDSPDFSATGVFGMTRHPWYFGSLLLIWSVLPQYPLPVFLAAVVLSIYLVVGTVLEERKILARYGDAYRLYRQQVSMLFPWKWLKRKLQEVSSSRRRP